MAENINFRLDQKEFDKNVQKLLSEVQPFVKEIILDASTAFVKAAVKYTPPEIGKGSINKKFYVRPISYIPNLIKKGKYTQEDIENLRAHKPFKVLNTRRAARKGSALGYTRKITEAKRMAKILTRGLWRFAWTQCLDSIKAQQVPAAGIIKRKAPDVDKYQNGTANLSESDTGIAIVLDNRISQYEGAAINQGDRAAERVFEKRFKQYHDEKKEKDLR